jgi:RNA polymerase sigma-70 factor (ECF subfamily)
MNDKEIIQLYCDRDETAIAETAKKYGSYCQYIAHNILHNQEDAEECVNDTYLGAWKSIPPQLPLRLSTYLGKITRNLSLNRYQQYTAEKRGGGQTELALAELEDCIPADQDMEKLLDDMVLTEAIERFLYRQTEDKRNIFTRRYWYLSPIRDIAKEYGMTESKVSSILFRMRNELKAHLEKEGIPL